MSDKINPRPKHQIIIPDTARSIPEHKNPWSELDKHILRFIGENYRRDPFRTRGSVKRITTELVIYLNKLGFDYQDETVRKSINKLRKQGEL